ncbi:MAG: beta-lactamase family protein, partial [Gammaproteobacteria bacterium]|nr:beta-lactamase family protein [Gammaproteobacteria bacterium]
MKHLSANFSFSGAMISPPSGAHAQDSRLTQAYVSETIGQARKNYRLPAVAVTVMNSEKILLREIPGVRVKDRKDQATFDDYFHIGSGSKSVLALMAARLVEQNKMLWQTRFFDVFPELKANARHAYHTISLEDLFRCEAGIRAYTNAAIDRLSMRIVKRRFNWWWNFWL